MPRARSVAVEIEGFAELQRELRKAGDQFPKELRKENLTVAKYVTREAIATATALGGVAAHAFPDGLKAKGEQRYALVTLDSVRHPEVLGAEFGGGLYAAGNPKSTTGARPGFTSQFKEWRGSGADAGYALYPTIRREGDVIVEKYGELVDRMSKRAFPN